MSNTKKLLAYVVSGAAAFGFGSMVAFFILLGIVYVTLRKADD